MTDSKAMVAMFDAFDNANQGLAIWDEGDNLIGFNSIYRDIFKNNMLSEPKIGINFGQSYEEASKKPGFQLSSENIKQRFEIVGIDPGLDRAIEKAIRVSPTDISVLITGESGVGKEIFPKIIHQLSHRKHNKFIAVNCGAIPEGTIDSELFGHEKGAFTGATSTRSGYFEVADGGTIFLDEIGDMSLAAQAKVLRALEENKIQRVGSQKDIIVDVRVLAATNKDLKKEINNGNFREDLYHRLAVIMIEVPELSKRKSDIPILVDHFSNLISKEQGIEKKKFSKDALKLLEDSNWSGNVRELRNVVERLIILGGETISKNDVSLFASKK